MRRFSAYLMGAVCGALVGSMLALLLTPASGEELKSRAAYRLATLRDELREAYDARTRQLEAELEALKHPPAKRT
jgi:gas vesicle protein